MLAYEYKAGSARLDDLPEMPISPHLYVLCNRCAESLRPPRGWVLDDRRTKTAAADRVAPVEPPPAVVELDDDRPLALEPEIREPEDLAPEDGTRQLAFGYSA